jgi:hypothetical protein
VSSVVVYLLLCFIQGHLWSMLVSPNVGVWPAAVGAVATWVVLTILHYNARNADA